MKKLILLLSIVFAAAMALSITIPALAASFDTTTISGTIPAIIEVEADSWTNLNTLTPGAYTESANKSVTVRCNMAGWTLTASDKKTKNKGHMYINSSTALINPIEIIGGDLAEYQSLAGDVKIKNGTGVSGSTTVIVKFRQMTEWTDALGDYGMTVTFTATTS